MIEEKHITLDGGTLEIKLRFALDDVELQVLRELDPRSKCAAIPMDDGERTDCLHDLADIGYVSEPDHEAGWMITRIGQQALDEMDAKESERK